MLINILPRARMTDWQCARSNKSEAVPMCLKDLLQCMRADECMCVSVHVCACAGGGYCIHTLTEKRSAMGACCFKTENNRHEMCCWRVYCAGKQNKQWRETAVPTVCLSCKSLRVSFECTCNPPPPHTHTHTLTVRTVQSQIYIYIYTHTNSNHSGFSVQQLWWSHTHMHKQTYTHLVWIHQSTESVWIYQSRG